MDTCGKKYSKVKITLLFLLLMKQHIHWSFCKNEKKVVKEQTRPDLTEVEVLWNDSTLSTFILNYTTAELKYTLKHKVAE